MPARIERLRTHRRCAPVPRRWLAWAASFAFVVASAANEGPAGAREIPSAALALAGAAAPGLGYAWPLPAGIPVGPSRAGDSTGGDAAVETPAGPVAVPAGSAASNPDTSAISDGAATPSSARPVQQPPQAPPQLPSPMNQHGERVSPSRGRSYRWQTLIANGASALAFAVNPGLGIVAFTLAAPLVHISHEKPLTGLASLGIHVASPFVLAVLGGGAGYLLDGDHPGDTGGFSLLGLALGFGGGIALSVVLDATVFGYDEPAASPPSSAAAAVRGSAHDNEGSTVHLVPVVASTGTGVGVLGLAGTF